MLHDRVMSKSAGGELGLAERRHFDRVPFPAELVLAWNHDQGSPVRYHVIDASDAGYRIHSSFPMLEGTTGMVVRLLPGRGKPMAQPVMVAWCAPAEEELGGYDIGIRLF